MGRVRHWKERWDPNAVLVFTKTRHLSGDIHVTEGTILTNEMKAELGRHQRARLRSWWDSQYLRKATEEELRAAGLLEDLESEESEEDLESEESEEDLESEESEGGLEEDLESEESDLSEEELTLLDDEELDLLDEEAEEL